jgi:hypothetical protein
MQFASAWRPAIAGHGEAADGSLGYPIRFDARFCQVRKRLTVCFLLLILVSRPVRETRAFDTLGNERRTCPVLDLAGMSLASTIFRSLLNGRKLTGGIEPRLAASGNVGQRRRLCRQCGHDRPSRLDPGVGQFLDGVSVRTSLVVCGCVSRVT